jgi:hypothetical protein
LRLPSLRRHGGGSDLPAAVRPPPRDLRERLARQPRMPPGRRHAVATCVCTATRVSAETPRVLPAPVVAGGLPDACGPVWLSMVLAPSGLIHFRARPIR